MLDIKITNKTEFQENLRTSVPRVLQVLRVKLNALLFLLQSKTVTEKLSGQMLKRRTGNLARSVRVSPAEIDGTRISGAVLAGGSTAFYGKFYEDVAAGGTGGVPHSWTIMATKARALAFMMDGKKVFAKSVMHPPLATRPFASSTLTEMSEQIRAELQAAADGELKGE